jgi:AraC-like DNA-binding protein
MIRFGSMSTVLLLGALYGVMRAAMLCFIPVNRMANRCMAGLIVVLALFTSPYIIGFAGYYDAYPWLSYFPYNVTLAIGPLLYLYLVSLSDGKSLPHWGWHLVPAAVQFCYYCMLFVQPLAFKDSWDAKVHVPLIDKVETLALLISLACYWTLACRHYLGSARSEWLRNFLIATGLSVTFWYLLAAAELAWSGLSYFQRFPFYLWLAVLVCYLGTEGYRHGAIQMRQSVPAAPAEPVQLATVEPAAAPPSYAELGERWRQMIIANAWWRDPELSLANLARLLGTNTTTLSRALNEGLGLNFNETVNRIRVDAVLAALQQASEDQQVLDIAFSEGFNSKASFNRAFKLYTGETPTEYRRRFSTPAQVSTSE